MYFCYLSKGNGVKVWCLEKVTGDENEFFSSFFPESRRVHYKGESHKLSQAILPFCEHTVNFKGKTTEKKQERE